VIVASERVIIASNPGSFTSKAGDRATITRFAREQDA